MISNSSRTIVWLRNIFLALVWIAMNTAHDRFTAVMYAVIAMLLLVVDIFWGNDKQ